MPLHSLPQRLALVFLSLAVMTSSGFAQEPAVRKSPSPATETSAQWESLFDGKTLEGWQGAEGFWSVVDGAITGQTTEERKLEQNSFLIWQEGELQNFELKLKFRIEKGNSGIQFRSQDLGDFHVGGYQADIDANKRFTGILYEERGRGILAERGQQVTIDEAGRKAIVELPLNPQEFSEKVNEEEWCDYHIVADGNRIVQTINGIKCVEVIDGQQEKAATRGILAFQIHVGPPMIVQFKDIQLLKKD